MELGVPLSAKMVGRFLKSARPHQWSKNILVFVPLGVSHIYLDLSSIADALLAFIVFCMIASGTYFANDLLDLEADRQHPTKRFRPLPSGQLPVIYGVMGAVALPVVGLGVAIMLLPLPFCVWLVFYIVLSTSYSFFFKKMATIDILVLGILYTSRVLAGASAIEVAPSFWLIAFSIFLFISLAYMKRYIEIVNLPDGRTSLVGRGYDQADGDAIFVLGVANSVLASLVLALYVNDAGVRVMYVWPELLWCLCLLMLLWTNRIWLAARRNSIGPDPLLFILSDTMSRRLAVAGVLVMFLAKWLPDGQS